MMMISLTKNLDSVDDNVTRWLEYFSLFGYVQQFKIAKNSKQFVPKWVQNFAKH